MSKKTIQISLLEKRLQQKAVNETDLEQFDNYSHANRLQNYQTLSVKSFRSEKKANQIRARIFRAKSEKESSQKELSNISEKLSFAKKRLISAQKRYQIILDESLQLTLKFQLCIINNSNQKDSVVESINKNQRQRQKARQRLREAQAQFKKIEETYQKATEMHKKLLMKKHMI